jgi:XTP/dITP diphosphohydrolase
MVDSGVFLYQPRKLPIISRFYMNSTAPPILLAGTLNGHKLAEIAAILAGLPVRVAGARALREVPAAAETGETFEENARLKAIHYARAAAELAPDRRPRWVISDDSGLCVEALGGAPGVLSARYAGPGPGDPRSDPERDARNNARLLAELAGVPAGRRGAAFVCAIACASVPEGGGAPGVLIETRGECGGRIADSPRGEGGFGYDPLFFLPELGRTYAELSEEEKNRISHRGRALARFAEEFAAVLGQAPAGAPGSRR